MSSALLASRSPILSSTCPVVKPGVPRSMMKQVLPSFRPLSGFVCANSRYSRARFPFEMNRFLPLMTHPRPFLDAVVTKPAG